MDHVSDVDAEKLRKLWRQLQGFNPSEFNGDSLLEELFEAQTHSLKDTIQLLSTSIAERKQLTAQKFAEVQRRQHEIQLALGQFPMAVCYPHVEARRSHLERELGQLVQNLREEEVSSWKDVQQLYRGLIYLMYKERTLETVKRAINKPSDQN